MKITILSLTLALFVSACSNKADSEAPNVEKPVAQAKAPTTGFVREASTITLDTEGSSLVFTNASNWRLSYAITWITRTGGRDTLSMPDGFFKQDGWFVYVESPTRVWMFDGVRQLDLLTESGRNAVTMPGVFAACPQAVWDALPEPVNKLLHDKKPN